MARLWQGGAELNSTTDGVEVSLNSGAVSISTTTVRSGTYAWRANPTTSTGFWRHIIFTSNQSTHVYLRAYLYIASMPTVTVQLLRFSTIANATTARIDLTTTGTLILKNAASAQVGSASSALSTGQWYRIELELDASSNPGSLAGYIDGTSFASGANSSQGSWGRILWGAISPNTTTDLFFDDLALNDTSGTSQTGLPGSGKVIHLQPNAAGDANSFAVQVGGTLGSANNYTRVSEVTPDDATTYNGSAVLNQEDLLKCTASGIGSSDIVNTVLVGGRIADLVSADASAGFKFEIIKASGGTKSQSVDIVPNSTTWGTNAGADPRTYPIILYKDPDASSWTQATLDTMQIGYTLDVVNTQTVAVSTIWASVDYTPAAATTTSTSSSTSTTTSSTSSSTSVSSTSSSTSISTSSTSSSTSQSTSTSISTSSTSSSTSTSTSSTSSSISTSSTSSSISTSSTSSSTSASTSLSTSTSTSTSSTSSSISTSSTSSSTSLSTSTSTSTSTSSTSSSTSISTSSTSSSISTSSTSSSTSQSTSTSHSTSTSISTSSTSSSTSISTSSTSSSTSTSSTSSSTSISTSSTSISTSSTSSSTSQSTSTSSTSSSTSQSTSTSISTSSTSSSISTSSSSSTSLTITTTSTSTSTTLIDLGYLPRAIIRPEIRHISFTNSQARFKRITGRLR